MTYAKTTSVPVERSKTEIERTLQRYGASQFIYGWDQDEAVVGFVVKHEGQSRQIRFKVKLPTADELRSAGSRRRSPSQIETALAQTTRQRWRALLLIIKAKLEAIEIGIATFEDEFLAYTMLPSGQTVGEWVAPQLEEVYETGVMPGSLRLALPTGGDQ